MAGASKSVEYELAVPEEGDYKKMCYCLVFMLILSLIWGAANLNKNYELEKIVYEGCVLDAKGADNVTLEAALCWNYYVNTEFRNDFIRMTHLEDRTAKNFTRLVMETKQR